ncbi:hypothetical protein [Gordonia soli]|uniref:Uncharacterized protein n=1 Tax=Gordonia soli NBRC 108243 TaxID=1223545 RepID=M0QDK0_9ACTN|nr:hypothetical protein [Gordonia soli]GAC66514.1 hypothetical protein GS4_02_02250 [Gordonia soli NBRC 108243]
MSTPVGDRRRGRNREAALHEFPAWGLEIMMGLYGPETIRDACADGARNAAESAPTDALPGAGPLTPTGGAAPAHQPAGCGPRAADPVSPMMIELEAINELARYLERKLRRR